MFLSFQITGLCHRFDRLHETITRALSLPAHFPISNSFVYCVTVTGRAAEYESLCHVNCTPWCTIVTMYFISVNFVELFVFNIFAYLLSCLSLAGEQRLPLN